MRIKVLLFDESNGKDILGFQKTCLNILHLAVTTQVDISINVIEDENSLNKYDTFMKCFHTMSEMLKDQLKEVKTEVWLTIFSYKDMPFISVKNSEYVAILKVGDDLDVQKIAGYLVVAVDKDLNPDSKCVKSSDPALDAAERALYSGTRISIEDEFKHSETASNPKKRIPTKNSPEIIAMENILEGKNNNEEE